MEDNNSIGPYDSSVLHLQASHRSELVWQTGYIDPSHYRRREATISRVTRPDPRIDPYLRQIGFYGVSRLNFIQLDCHLITALVERWRQETHTFHLSHGECTVTLPDFAIKFELPIDRKALIGSFQHTWRDVCTELIGVTPGERDLVGDRLSLPWLANQFDDFAHLPDDVDDVALQRYASAYILTIIRGIVFSDRLNSRVHLMYLPLLADFGIAEQYSWGASCLAWLYRQLCKAVAIDAQDIAGPVILLQIWA
ncbi:serine/threonine-protein phosphatase 7 long form homolog [Momordica charantia]|uniref:Serine/threonine-protein phosphatase 7 long form homolog n=1 Tax=Momordica charantia TaxID=3673 RepID=A0A6J1DTQ9_MOMCH|nr:serine/threonine-protein phosphatase 7 long form homolog [Momordica charantia]